MANCGAGAATRFCQCLANSGRFAKIGKSFRASLFSRGLLLFEGSEELLRLGGVAADARSGFEADGGIPDGIFLPLRHRLFEIPDRLGQIPFHGEAFAESRGQGAEKVGIARSAAR